MDSIFIRKSIAGPGGLYKPITQMTKPQRDVLRQRILQRRSTRKLQRGPLKGLFGGKEMGTVHEDLGGIDPAKLRAQKARGHYEAMGISSEALGTGERSVKPGFTTKNLTQLGLGGGVAVQGSKRNAQKTLFHNKRTSMNRAVQHEVEHARPQRSGYRLAEIISDPSKLAREEARADWMSGSARWDKKRHGETLYARTARKKVVKPNPMRDAMLGGNASEFGQNYAKQQRTFRDKGIPFGANADRNAKYAQENFGVKPKNKTWDRIRFKAEGHPYLIRAGAVAAPTGAYALHRKNEGKPRKNPPG